MHRISHLSNGITLVNVPVPGTKAITVLAMFPVGSRYEERRLSGISHFVEHVMFKGTDKRATTLDISRDLDRVGAHYNAFTNKEYTGYYIKIAEKKQDLAYDILSDMLFNSRFDSDEIEKEKGAIVEELRMYSDNPLMDIDSLFEALLFGDNALGWDIGGTAQSVRGMSRDDLWSFYQKHYSAKNMILVLAGAVDSEKTKKITNFFGTHAAPKDATSLAYYSKKFDRVNLAAVSKKLQDRVSVKEKKVDQAQCIIGFPAFKTNHPDRFVLAILSTILGGGMSSRLFTEVREKRGLAYMVRSGISTYRDVGSFYIQAGLDPSRIKEAFKVIFEQFQKIKTDLVNKKELDDACNNILGSMALQMEDSYQQAQWYAEKLLFSTKIETPATTIKNLKKVTATQVRRVAQNLLSFEKAHYAAIGSFDKTKFLTYLK